ncbi:MAG TPA: decaprenyl-phosphate phosphoribosyltransferase [Thermodesulfobacteriota bacterium]|nr:decaprenyl-phosphate phosphoribosyltransferase [Thermodesulfobacteriota bacterium]
MSDFLRDIAYLLRPHQWVKNLLVLAPPFFGGALFTNGSMFLKMFLAFVGFSLASSTAYIINDITDVEHDRHHPQKRQRPLSSGRISILTAVVLCFITLALSIAASYTIGLDFLMITLAYLALSLSYSFYLQRIEIIDVFCIAAGFVLRIEAGGIASGIEVSNWLLLTTFLLSLLLAFGKRRHELALHHDPEKPFREVLQRYNTNFLDTTLSIFATTAIVTYAIYTVEIESRIFLLTVPFAIYGVLRYMYLVQTDTRGDPTESLFQDRPLLFSVVVWFLITTAVIYFKDFSGFIE